MRYISENEQKCVDWEKFRRDINRTFQLDGGGEEKGQTQDHP